MGLWNWFKAGKQGKGIPEESLEQIRKKVELYVSQMDKRKNPEELFQDFQRVQCAICGRTCWRSRDGQVEGDADFIASYHWHKAGWCKTCSIAVCGICSFLTGHERKIKADICPRCETEIE